MPSMRLVSLVPSITETLLSWGADVVACSRFCEQPQLRHVGGTKDPDIAAIIGLAPDLVLLDREENRRDDAAALAAAGVAIHVTHVTALAHVEPMLRELAVAVGCDPPRLAPRRDEVRGLDRLTAFVPIWRRPWMAIGPDTYASSLLDVLAISTVPVAPAVVYPTVELGEAAGWHPDLVLLPSEPYPFAERHRGEVAAAMPEARVVLVDGRDLFWWGVRTPVAIERLRGVLRAPPQRR